MKLTHVVTSVNHNDRYLSCIPYFVKAWKLLFPEVEITILMIGSSVPNAYKQYESHIKLIPNIEGMHDVFQAQCIRLLYPALIPHYGGVLITDMDMIPMNRRFYEDTIEDIEKDKFVIYRDIIEKDEYFMCYNIALASTWSKIFNIQCMDDIVSTLKSWYSNITFTGIRGGEGWSTDQLMLRKYLDEWNKETGNLVKFQDFDTLFVRLCRDEIAAKKGISQQDAHMIENLIFSDYHMLVPTNQFESLNQFIMSKLETGVKKYIKKE